MKTLLLLCFPFIAIGGLFAQTSYSTIASNRIIQKHFTPEKARKIAEIDSTRLQVLWNYFSASFEFNTSETGLSVTELLNIQQFDVSVYEQLRLPTENVQFVYRESIVITLKSGNELNTLLQGYNLRDLISNLPLRPFPVWDTESFTENDFQQYKERVWSWAKDYPSNYLALTNDPTIPHYLFSDLSRMTQEKRLQLLNLESYLIVD